MVAGLTADVFVQLTATLAHLSSTLNKTGSGSDGSAPSNGFRLPPYPPGYKEYQRGNYYAHSFSVLIAAPSLCYRERFRTVINLMIN